MADRLAGKRNLVYLKYWEARDTRGHKTRDITPSNACRREVLKIRKEEKEKKERRKERREEKKERKKEEQKKKERKREKEASDDFPWKDVKGPLSIRQLWYCLKAKIGKPFWETGWSAYWLSRAGRWHFELNWNIYAYAHRSSSCLHWDSMLPASGSILRSLPQ